ncbi:MAG: FAD-dependent oxidoreductase, partial [Clostridia bacterium]|nr:FAD-dependent oxidoreductase [Clostridia bacterium]
YDSGTAPCKAACPAHIAIQGYLQLAKDGRYEEALELIKMDNPFPAICGRVCNKRCEAACTRASLDRAVAIDDVKNFLAQRDLDAETRFVPQKRPPKVHGLFDEKIAIIGAGPAGLSAAYYLAILGYLPTVFERNEQPGGMMTYGIPNFKLEKDVVAAEIEVLKELGVEFRCGVSVGEDVTIQQLREEGYKAFYIAIGCQGSRKAGIPGEDAEDVVSAVDFLRDVLGNPGTKVSGKTVVIGGGNVAIDVARTAMRCGADQVTMFSLEQREEMPASDEEVEEALEENILIENGWGPKEVVLEGGKVTGVVFKRCTAVEDATGRFAPQYDENDTLTVDADFVVTSIGQAIDWGKLTEGLTVQFGRGNSLVIDEKTYQVQGEPDLFVGGDVMTGPKFVIDAIAQGHMASEVLHRYVRECVLSTGRNLREFIELDKTKVVLAPDQYDRPERQTPPCDPSIDKKSFRDARLVFTEEQVKAETSRCLSCGASVVDPKKCIGCGVCTNQCKFDAIHLYRDRPDCTDMHVYEDRMKAIIPWNIKRATRIVKKNITERLQES